MTDPLLYAEDLVIGPPMDLGGFTVNRQEMVAFARRWDPQPFHTDDGAAARTLFGEVIASGAYTLAVFQRLAVLGAYRHWAVIAGRVIREVHLPRPVTAGLTLTGVLTVTDVALSRPDRALVTKHGRLHADGHDVLTVVVEAYVTRRPTLANLTRPSDTGRTC